MRKKADYIIIISFLVTVMFFGGCSVFNQSARGESAAKEEERHNSELKRLSLELLQNSTSTEFKRLAVLPFTGIDNESGKLGIYLAEELTTHLHGEFEIYERSQLSKVKEELKLNMSGLIEEETIKEFGRFTGVEGILTGTYMITAKNIVIYARIILTETASIVSASTVSLEVEEYAELLEQTAKQAEESSIKSIMEKNGFKIEVTGCELEGMNLKIRLELTNKEYTEQEFQIQYGNPETKIYDNLGNEYQVSSVVMGNERKTFQKGGSGYQVIKRKLISELSVPVILEFEKVHPELTKIALLEINGGRAVGIISIYDLEVEKK
jgi:TolB-like protein